MPKILFLKKSKRVAGLVRGGAVVVAGAVSMHFLGGIGGVVVAAGLLLLAVAVIGGRRPLVTIDAKSIDMLFGKAVSVPIANIARVENLKTQDIVLYLNSGVKILIPMSRLEDEDGDWLRKSLRQTLRAAKANA